MVLTWCNMVGSGMYACSSMRRMLRREIVLTQQAAITQLW